MEAVVRGGGGNSVAVQSSNLKGGKNCGNTERDAPSVCAVGKDLRIFHPGEELADYNFLFSLGRVEEVGPEGEIINTYVVDSSGKGTYEPLFTRNGISTSDYNSTVKKPTFIEEFNKSIHFGVLTTSTNEHVNCTGCSGGTAGFCQNVANLTCRDISASGKCPRRFFPCTEDITVEKDTFTISAEFINLNFSSPENKLRYTTQVKVKRNAGSGSGNEPLFDFLTEGLFETPTTATAIAPDGSKRIVDVIVFVNRISEGTYEFVYEFYAVPDGDKIYYN